MNEVDKFPLIQLLNKTNHHYTYSSLIEQFKDMLVDCDMAMILDDELRFIYVEGSVAFRKRYMTINMKRIVKKDKEMSAIKTPLLALQAAVMHSEDYDGMFDTDWFNIDMSNIAAGESVGDVIFQNIDRDRGIDCSIVMIPTKGKLNIEATIMEDSAIKLSNIRTRWNKVRRNTSPDTFIGCIENILPPYIAIHAMFELGVVSTNEELSKMTYRDIFDELVKYLSPNYTLRYKTDTSSGCDEIMLVYGYEILVEPKIINYTEPQQEEWIKQGGLLTRGFDLTFSMASMYDFRNARYTNLFNRDIADIIRRTAFNNTRSSTSDITSSGRTIKQEGNKLNDNTPVYNEVMRGMNLVCTAIYQGMDGVNQEIDMYDYLFSQLPAIKAFHDTLLSEKADISLFFYIDIQIYNNDGYSPMNNADVQIDYNMMKIKVNTMRETLYSIAIYMNKEHFDDWKING